MIYQGIRLTPAQIAAAARDEDVDVIGLSILSGSHMELIPEVVRLLRAEGVTAPVFAGGIIPEEDREPLLEAGVAEVFTPKDYELSSDHGPDRGPRARRTRVRSEWPGDWLPREQLSGVNFASDNNSGVCPEVLAAIIAEAETADAAYGSDRATTEFDRSRSRTCSNAPSRLYPGCHWHRRQRTGPGSHEPGVGWRSCATRWPTSWSTSAPLRACIGAGLRSSPPADHREARHRIGRGPPRRSTQHRCAQCGDHGDVGHRR